MITDLVYHVSLCFHVSSSCSAPRPRMAAALRALSSRRAAWLCFAPGFAHQEYLHTGTDIKGCVALSPQSCVQLIRIGGRLCPPGSQGHPGNPEAALSRWWTGVRGSDLKPSGGFQQGGAPVAQRARPTPSLPGLTSLPLTISWDRASEYTVCIPGLGSVFGAAQRRQQGIIFPVNTAPTKVGWRAGGARTALL